MTASAKTLPLYGNAFEFSAPQVAANTIRAALLSIAQRWQQDVEMRFLVLFPSLDELYSKGDSLADKVRTDAVSEAMKMLASFGIYDLSEAQFYERFVSQYDTWADDFDAVASQYESIVEQTAELDAYRTARRQNRQKWVGYGSREAIRSANYENHFNNALHGAFNMFAKGVTAIGNAIEKNRILKEPATVAQISSGIVNIVMATYFGTVDAVNAEHPGAVHVYSSDSEAKVEAIVTNVEKGRIPAADVPRMLLRGMLLYPYDLNLYALLLARCGGDSGRLDAIVSYFGLQDWDQIKKQVFEAHLKAFDLTELQSCRINLPKVASFAAGIGYTEFDAAQVLLSAQSREFDLKLAAVDLTSVSSCQRHQKALQNYAASIGFTGFDARWKDVVTKAAAGDFQLEIAKYPLVTMAECEKNLPALQAFASSVGFPSFESFAMQTRASAATNDVRQKKRNRSRQAIGIFVLLILAMFLVPAVMILFTQELAPTNVTSTAEQAPPASEQSAIATPATAPTQPTVEQDAPESETPAASSPDSPVPVTAEVSVPTLPFVGKREFNFSGGSATVETIEIASNGQTTITMCGDAAMGGTYGPEYAGPFSNPMVISDGSGWFIEGESIVQLRNGEVVLECGDDGQQRCDSKLYPF